MNLHYYVSVAYFEINYRKSVNSSGFSECPLDYARDDMKKKCIENSFFNSKFYSRYTSSVGRSTRIDEF